MVSKKDFNRLR